MKNNNDSPALTDEAKTKTTNTGCNEQQNKDCAKKTVERISLYEKNKRAVYATGNKWAIENFHATHD